MFLDEDIAIQIFVIVLFALVLFYGLVHGFKSMIKQEKELKEWKQNIISKLDDIKMEIKKDER